MTIHDLFLMTATQRPGDIAIVDDAGETTFGSLSVHSALLAFKLMDSTTRPNVAILLPPCAGFAASFYATLLAGKAAVPLNLQNGAARLERLVEEAGIDTMLTSAVLEQLVPRSITNRIFLEAPNVSTQNYKSVPDFPERHEDDVAAIFFGGAGGESKGLRLTHKELLAMRRGFAEAIAFEVKDITMGSMPGCNAHGLACALLMSSLAGARAVLVAHFDPAGLPAAIEKHKPTILCLAPEQIHAVAEAGRRGGGTGERVKYGLSSVRVVLCAGTLPHGAAEKFEAAFGLPIRSEG